MTHPEELLAAYVDGTLARDERAQVDRHLATCARCRDEVGLAAGARVALGRLPQVEAPVGIASGALREASGGLGARAPRWIRWVPAAAAAALVATLALTLPHLFAGSAPSTAGLAEQATGGLRPTSEPSARSTFASLQRNGVSLEKQNLDYSSDSVRVLLDQTATFWSAERLTASSDALASGRFQPRVGDPSAGVALRCVLTNVSPPADAVLVRLIEASYQGERAYLAVVLEGSGPGKPTGRVDVWVVREDGCGIVSFAERAR